MSPRSQGFGFGPAHKSVGGQRVRIVGHYTAQVFLGVDPEGRQRRPNKLICPPGCGEPRHRNALVAERNTEAAARKAASAWADTVRTSTGTGGTFDAIAATLLAHPELATSTRRGYVSRLRPGGRILTHFGGRQISEIRTRDIAEWRDHWAASVRAGTIAASTANQDLSIIKAVMRTAFERGHIPTNPASGIRRIRQGEPAIHAPSPAEAAAVYDHLIATGWPADRVIAAMVATATHTGMRLGELLVLRWEDVVLHTGIPVDERRAIEDWPRIHVRWAYDGDHGRKRPKSERGLRTIVLTEQITAILSAWRAGQPETPWVFHSVRGTGGHIYQDRPIKRLHDLAVAHRGMVEPCELCGLVSLEVRMHGLRHLAGATAADAGVPVTAIAEMLGDDPRTVERHYIRTDQGSIAAAVAVGRALNAARDTNHRR